MQRRGTSSRLISYLMFAMLSASASVYIAGRLWQNAQYRIYLIKELDRRINKSVTKVLEVKPVVTVSNALKFVACRDQHNRLLAIETELVAARQEGFVSKCYLDTDEVRSVKRLRVVIGISTGFRRKENRDAIRKSWVRSGVALKRLEEDKGIIVRFVIGRSANKGDSFDRAIIEENKHTKDFVILDNHVEASEGIPKKMKLFFIHASETWDADFFAKVNDNVYVDIDVLGKMLSTHLEKSRVYIGCMKSSKVFSDSIHRWYEPDWWKFGDGNSYFLHASSDIYVISRALAQFISMNRYILHTYAHDDVSLGSWMIGLDVYHVSERKLCCSLRSPGAICAIQTLT